MAYNVICDRTGFKRKNYECRKEWNGLLVWKKVWERRHPQDRLPAAYDDFSIKEPRPEQPDRFLAQGEHPIYR